MTGGVIVLGLLVLFYYDRANKKAKQAKLNLLKVTPWREDPSIFATPPEHTATGVGGFSSSGGGSLESDASYSDSSEDASSDDESSENLFDSSYSRSSGSRDSQYEHDEGSISNSNFSSECSSPQHAGPIATAGRSQRLNSRHSHSSLSADEWWQSVLEDMDYGSASDK